MCSCLLPLLLPCFECQVSCVNENGRPVDWYIIYKLPFTTRLNGLKYLYMDGTTKGWIEGQRPINHEESAITRTLEPFFKYKETLTENFGFILYSDQPPDQYPLAAASFGHSKGVVMMDGNTGVWLTHSTPKFPAGTKKTTFWPSSGNQNGQTFFCGIYEYSEFQNIAVQLKYIHIYSFDYHIPKTFQFYEELHCVASRGCYPKKQPWYRWHIMTSLAGNRFVSLAKYHRFGDDLYSGLLQKDLGTAIFAKSWGRMRTPLPSNCSIQHSVLNVKMVQLYDAFPITMDHSKWCVSVNISRPWTCIADMNRDKSQMSRGGGAVCTDLPAVWWAFSHAVNIYEPCPP